MRYTQYMVCVRFLKRGEIVVPTPKYVGVMLSDAFDSGYESAWEMAEQVLFDAGLTGRCNYHVQICPSGYDLCDVWLIFTPRLHD